MTSTQSSSQICRCGSTKAVAAPVHPRFDLGADQVEDVMAYFKSLNGESQ